MRVNATAEIMKHKPISVIKLGLKTIRRIAQIFSNLRHPKGKKGDKPIPKGIQNVPRKE